MQLMCNSWTKLTAIAGKKSPAFLRGRLLQGYLLFASAGQTRSLRTANGAVGYA
jgi:hypothetical protein